MLHVLVCISVIILPGKVVHSNQFTSTYRSVFVVGPFFYESRIKSFSILSIRLYSKGMWSQVGEGRVKNFSDYRRSPWRYDLLRKNDFEEYCADQIASFKNKDFETVKRSKPFRELNQFIIGEHTNDSVDSVSITYITKAYSLENSSFSYDTAFVYIYNPNEVTAGKH
ncbi:MAG TPA: hypothetical protein VIU13_08475 [Chryseolinea sp.]